MSWLSSGRVAIAVAGLAAAVNAAPGQEAVSGSLSLTDCVREALTANADLGAAAARAGAAEAGADVAASALRPRVDLGGGYLYSEREQRLVQPARPGEAIRYEDDLVEAVVEARLPLYAGGRLAARAEAASRGAASSRLVLEAERQEVALAVSRSYLAAVAGRAAVESIEASLAALEAQVGVARDLEEFGRIPPLDRLKVEVRAAEVRQALSAVRRERELVLQRLASLLGRSTSEPPLEVAEAPEPLAISEGVEALASSALSVHPEIASLREEVARAEAEVAAVRGERWPAVDLYARYTARSALPSEAAAGLPGHLEWGAGGLSLRLPLWTAGELAARIREVEARRLEAKERLRGGEIRIVEEVRRQAAALAEAVEREGVAQGAVEQAREAYAIEQAAYELGRGVINDVLDAEAARLDAELALTRARHDRGQAAAALARAAGLDLVALLGVDEKEKG